MWGFLLIASAFHLDYQKLKEQRWPVLLLSTMEVIISTGVFGGLLCVVTLLFHIQLPAIYCFLFGAIISPTDPIAVADILKNSKIPPRLNTSVTLPAVALLRKLNFSNLSILTGAGLRGGISVAVALMLPKSPYREIILSSCYFVFIFSIIFQGLTLTKVVEITVRYKAE
jgi:NhaP-type Na+/H+ or K+/H+ antiporter